MHKKYSKKLEVLIIGKGSIGLRHAKIFRNLGCKVYFFRTNNSNLENDYCYKEYFDLKRIKKLSFDLIAICNPSSFHIKYLKKFHHLSKNFLIEKPLCTNNKDLNLLKKISRNKNIYSGYMLRHDKRILEIKQRCKNTKKINFAFFKWHTYLPDWHKYENYKNSYAAKKKLGGGVIFTCSHEVDMAIFLFGKVKNVICYEKKKELNLEVEESVNIYLNHINGINSLISIDFSNKDFIREFKVFFKNKIIKYNFKNTNVYEETFKKNKIIKVLGKNHIEQFYRVQNIAILKNIQKKIKKYLSVETEKVLLSCHKSLKLKKEVKVL
jgi:predicted dehydrogenase